METSDAIKLSNITGLPVNSIVHPECLTVEEAALLTWAEKITGLGEKKGDKVDEQ